MDLIFCKLRESQKMWIEFFASSKMLKKHGFNFFASLKNSKNMDLIFCKLQKAQKTWI